MRCSSWTGFFGGRPLLLAPAFGAAPACGAAAAFGAAVLLAAAGAGVAGFDRLPVFVSEVAVAPPLDLRPASMEFASSLIRLTTVPGE
eukprot:1656432-Amphidinium_carterae.1